MCKKNAIYINGWLFYPVNVVFSNKERVRAAKKAGKESYFDKYSKVGATDKVFARSVSSRFNLLGFASLTPFSALGHMNIR